MVDGHEMVTADARLAEVEQERDENEKVFIVWRRRCNEAEAEVARLREGLRYIAEPDALLDANDHAARRMQAQARYLLGEA